ncbi:MBOAT family O-acyltransferase, partial [Nostoc sp. NIES-2111]
MALPIGISFFTFQAMSFVVDVYRGDTTASVGLARFAMFKAFFPQLVAGPIERPGSLIPQFDTQRRLTWPVVAWGLLIVLWGVFKKVVVADNIAPVVETVYGAPAAHMPAALALATVLFAIQIYCDFSGYSDIARGCARILGFRLMINFDRPYAARSFRDFWRRWHISLSTWFRDYVYLPLGGRKVGIPRYIVNVGI